MLFWVPLAALCATLYLGLMVLFSGLAPDLVEDSNDLKIYQAAGEAILQGEIPYRDFFIEYPPGSFLTFIPPALLSEDVAGFAGRFASEMALLLVAALILASLTARRTGLRAWPGPAIIFTVGALMLYPVAVTRYDALVALTLAFAAWSATLGGRYPILGYAALGLGAAAKLVPALATVPLALVRENGDRGGLRYAAWGYGIFFAVVALFFVPAYLAGGDELARSFAYHADRGLQVESVGASILMNLGLVTGVGFEYGAFEVRGPGAEFLSSMSLPVTAALLLVTMLMSYRAHRVERFSAARFPRYAAALILAFMLGSKVLSPQYMVWLLPLVPLAFGGWTGLGISAVFLAACWTTTQIYPHHYADLLYGRPPGPGLLLGRNLMLALLWAAMLFLPTKGRKAASP